MGTNLTSMRLFDTAQNKIVPLKTSNLGEVSMYVCGPTVYSEPHLGHGRFALVFDVLRRYLESTGFKVTYVSNITDVDDKIINRAKAEGLTPLEVAARYEKVWYETLDKLGVLRPTYDPHATEYIPQMISLVEKLVAEGFAYVLPDGVYLETGKVPGHGILARQDLTELRPGARVELHAGKRNPGDFALWKLVTDDTLAWKSPWGTGRPGWHTECVAMSLDLLGDQFDIHGGGQDLAFPHHENERAQAVVLGKVFATHWIHNGFVVDPEGAKLAKSEGNFDPVNSYLNLVDLLEDADHRSYRLLVLQSHYRSPLTVSRATVKAAENTLHTIDSLSRRGNYVEAEAEAKILEHFHNEMQEDFGSHRALAYLFDAMREANSAYDAGNTTKGNSLTKAILDAFKMVGIETKESSNMDTNVASLVAARDDARKNRNWEAADRIRKELSVAGWQVEDTAEGTRVYK